MHVSGKSGLYSQGECRYRPRHACTDPGPGPDRRGGTGLHIRRPAGPEPGEDRRGGPGGIERTRYTRRLQLDWKKRPPGVFPGGRKFQAVGIVPAYPGTVPLIRPCARRILYVGVRGSGARGGRPGTRCTGWRWRGLGGSCGWAGGGLRCRPLPGGRCVLSG